MSMCVCRSRGLLWQSVARFTNIVVWCDFLHCSFRCFSRRQRKLIMKEPRLCMSNLSHGPIVTWRKSNDPKNSILAPPWLNRGLNSFCQTSFYYDSDNIQKFIPWYFPIFLLLIQCLFKQELLQKLVLISALPLIQNGPANTAVHSESLGGSVAERLEFWNCNPEAPSLIHSLTACRICPCLSRVQILIQSHW